jgi:5'-nucleotidase
MKKFWTLTLALLLFLSCQKEQPLKVTKVTAKTTPIDTSTEQDSTIIKEFLPYKEKMIAEINKVLSYAPKDLVRTDGNLQSSLGNLLADLTYEKANELFKKETGKNVDFCMSNYGGIRAGIFKGEVKVSNAFNLMPFDNTIVVVELTAEKVEELFEYFVVKNRPHPLSKHIQLIVDNGTYKIKINGKPINNNRTYFVATSNYLQKGGDNMDFFAEPESLFDSKFLIRNAIVEYFKNKDTLISNTDKRILIK